LQVSADARARGRAEYLQSAPGRAADSEKRFPGQESVMENGRRKKGVGLEAKILIFMGLALVSLMGLSYVWVGRRIDRVRDDLLEQKAVTTFSYVTSTLALLTGKESLEKAPHDKIRQALSTLSSKGVVDGTMLAGSEAIKRTVGIKEVGGLYVVTYTAPLFEGDAESNIGLSITFADRDVGKKSHALKMVLLVTIVSSVLVTLGIMYFIIRSAVVEPVRHLKDIAERIAAGDYAARSRITTGDELEQFSKSFNKMIEYLEDLNENLDAKLDDLGQANLRLYEMNRQQREFMAVVSHELRTPLNSIIGFSEILREQFKGKIDEKQDRFLRNIYTSGAHLLRLINQILDSVKLESGRLELRFSKVSVSKVIESALSMIDTSQRERVPVLMDLQEDLPVIVSDEGRLIQIVFNILSNAFKVSPEGEPIRIRAGRNTDVVRIEIQDRGPGIAKHQIPLIFEKFRQIDSSQTRALDGAGIGLSIVKELTSVLGGTVQVESEPGGGANFIVDIPVSPKQEKV